MTTPNKSDRRNVNYQVILEHAKKPRHRGKTNPVHRYQRGENPFCGDRIELTVQLDRTGDTIKEIKFEGEGCALAIASADLMANVCQGRTIEEALGIVEQFRNMMKGQAEFESDLHKLNVMQGVSQYPVRIKCALLSWHALKVALE